MNSIFNYFHYFFRQKLIIIINITNKGSFVI